MKAGNCWKWRPAMGVLVAGTLAFAVSVQGGPRVTDGKTALNKERARADTARMLTGPSEHINSVIAGVPGTAEIMLTPKVNNADGNAYAHGGAYDASNISGNTLTVDAGGFWAFWNVRGGKWDPEGDFTPLLRSTSGRIDSKSMQGANAAPPNPGCDITGVLPAGQPGNCSITPDCQALFNCVGAAKCGDAYPDPSEPPIPCNQPGSDCYCNWGWVNTSKDTHADGDQWIHNNAYASVQADWGLTSPTGPLVFSTAEPTEGRADDKYPAMYYIGSIVFDIPACAKGTYTMTWVDAETFFADPQNVQFEVIETPGVLVIPVGKCCHNIGEASAGCIDGLSKSLCEGVPGYGTAVWTQGVLCDNPPGPDGCAECQVAADCYEGTVPGVDGDKCTIDSCDAQYICHNDPDPEWDQATECCEAATGDICTPTVTNTCENAACSIPPNRGVCQITNITAGDPCNPPGDDNPCTFWDVCLADKSCIGTDVNTSMIPCDTDQDCFDATKGLTAPVCLNSVVPGVLDGICDCSLEPDLTIYKVESGKKDGHCFDSLSEKETMGAKVTAYVKVGAATAPINGGQFLITYDPTCLDYNSVAGVAPYTDAVYGPIVDEAAGTIFVVVGVGFGGIDGPAGNADMLSLSFTKVGHCNSCQICFGGENPENTYLVDNTGQKIGVTPWCSKYIFANGEVILTVPPSQRNLNVDCDQPTRIVTWGPPTVDDQCGESTIMCWGEHEGGALYSEEMAMGGGELPIGVSNFCCYAESNWCSDWDGCAPGMDCPVTPSDKEGFYDADGCWTIDINDETSLDIELQLSPSTVAKPGLDLTRCIKFTLYPNTIQAPLHFTWPVIFGETIGGAAMDHVGKVKDKIKIPGHDQWDCISAWDQLHTLRACYLFDPYGGDCIDGQLQASFTGDPAFGGNWMIGGNLDGWKKDVDGADPSLFVIDILDYGTFVAEWGENYGTGDTPCGTVGPHADIDGDGDVDLDDYVYIEMNFLASAKMCCGYEGLPAGSAGLTEISVRDLREMGRGELAVADLNGDGMLDMNDMQAFMQGTRPSTKSTRSGTR